MVSPYTGSTDMVSEPLKIERNIINGRASIWYTGHSGREVEISLYSPDGRKVRTLVNRHIDENGRYRISLNSDELRNGIYYLILREDGNVVSERRIMVVK